MSPPSCANSRYGNIPGRRFLTVNCIIDARYVIRKRTEMSMSPWGRAALICGEGAIQVVGPPHFEGLELDAQPFGGRLHAFPKNRGDRVGRISKDSYP